MIDLKPFCAMRNTLREYLEQPFSRGEFTYATNAHILVRVARRDGITDVELAPDCEKVLAACDFSKPFEILHCELPTQLVVRCDLCDGTGREHACPKCDCKCAACDGAGELPDETDISIEIAGLVVAGLYARQILSLKGLRIFPAKEEGMPIGFSFDEGVGAVMPLRGQNKHHVVAKLAEVF